MQPGPPGNYTEEFGARICDMLVSGTAENDFKPMSLRAICRLPDMPAMSTVMDWLERHQEFQSRYARARDLQADVRAEETIEISDNEKIAPDRARNMVLTRQWHTSKMAPKKYGDRTQMDLGGTVRVEQPAVSEVANALRKLNGDL